MADAPAPAKTGRMGFLSRKLGPLPVWAWGLIGFGAYYWYVHYGPGAQKAATPAAPAGQRPQVVIVNPREPRQPPQRQDGKRPPDRRPPHRQPRTRRMPAPVVPPPSAAPGGQPGQVVTPQAPVYDQWTADDTGVPDPGQAYAPMTAGSIYG